MKIKKLKLKNFKKFASQEFDFNDDLNVIVGDNESGKSSLLGAIETNPSRYRRETCVADTPGIHQSSWRSAQS
jgi:recombinational DNA repair ATPase RecF